MSAESNVDRYDLRARLKGIGVRGSDLVTRATGEQLRRALEPEVETGASLVVVDFSKVGVVDYSCADEVVAKMYVRLLAGEYGERFLLLDGLSEGQRENVEVALERKALAALGRLAGETEFRLLGTLNPYLRETLEMVRERGRLTARELSEARRLAMNTASTRLINLHDARLVTREAEPGTASRRQFAYRWLPSLLDSESTPEARTELNGTRQARRREGFRDRR